MKILKFFILTISLSFLPFMNAKANKLFKPYVGINGTGSFMKIEVDEFIYPIGNPLLSLNFGNTFNFRSFYIAPELNFNVIQNVLNVRENKQISDTEIECNRKVQIKDYGSVNLNLGYNITNNFSIFASINGSYIKGANIDKKEETNNFNKNQFILGFGAGFKYNINSKITAHVKYNYKKFKIKKDSEIERSIVEQRNKAIKSGINQYTFGLNYNF